MLLLVSQSRCIALVPIALMQCTVHNWLMVFLSICVIRIYVNPNLKYTNYFSEINLKQQLVDQLEKAQKNIYSMKSQYEEKMQVLQQQIKSIESERDRVLKDIGKINNLYLLLSILCNQTQNKSLICLH